MKRASQCRLCAFYREITRLNDRVCAKGHRPQLYSRGRPPLGLKRCCEDFRVGEPKP